MTHKRLYITSILCLLALSGCSDDSGGKSKTITPECTDNSQCESNVCLSSGKCAVEADEGEDCDDEAIICKTGFKCVDGKCKTEKKPSKPTEPEDKCKEDKDCDDGFICSEGE